MSPTRHYPTPTTIRLRGCIFRSLSNLLHAEQVGCLGVVLDWKSAVPVPRMALCVSNHFQLTLKVKPVSRLNAFCSLDTLFNCIGRSIACRPNVVRFLVKPTVPRVVSQKRLVLFRHLPRRDGFDCPYNLTR
ncbi:MAG: hypothetical protein J07HQX50_00469 [Haloquadratum sp. J07HQX50]|nr:MAG: hypothetical protein J07HQX50_00469 [Haloquadratum sp. J07HQX50]